MTYNKNAHPLTKATLYNALSAICTYTVLTCWLKVVTNCMLKETENFGKIVPQYGVLQTYNVQNVINSRIQTTHMML